MNIRFSDLCYNARINAKLTVEQASELLGIAPRTLSYYEAGRNVPDETVAKMMSIYNAPELGYMYIANETATGRVIFSSNINTRGIASRALELSVALREANKQQDMLENICCDDTLTENERGIFINCIKTLTNLATACISLKLFKQNKKTLQPK